MLRLSALAMSVEEDRDRLAVRLRLAHAEREALVAFAPPLARLGKLAPDIAHAKLYRSGGATWRRHAMAGWCMSDAARDDPAWQATVALPERWPIPKFPLKGADALALGMKPSPQVGIALRAVEEEWIAGDFKADRDTLLASLAGHVV